MNVAEEHNVHTKTSTNSSLNTELITVTITKLEDEYDDSETMNKTDQLNKAHRISCV
jgi:hypothetical protein